MEATYCSNIAVLEVLIQRRWQLLTAVIGKYVSAMVRLFDNSASPQCTEGTRA